MGGPLQQSTFAVVIGGATATLVIWALNTYFHAAIPDTIGGTVTTLVVALLSHFVPDTGASSPAPKA